MTGEESATGVRAATWENPRADGQIAPAQAAPPTEATPPTRAAPTGEIPTAIDGAGPGGDDGVDLGPAGLTGDHRGSPGISGESKPVASAVAADGSAETPSESTGESRPDVAAGPDLAVEPELAVEPDLAAEPEPALEDLRTRMIGQFTQWLDRTLAGEPPPRGLPEHLLAEATAAAADRPRSEESDLYTLFSALTALTGEIKLQGRAFKQLSDLLSPLAEMPAALAEIPAALARLYDRQDETAAVVRSIANAQAALGDEQAVDLKSTCDLMIDLYDRLQRGLQTCDDGIQSLRNRGTGGWLAKRLGYSEGIEKAVGSVQAIRDASGLAVARLQAALQQWGVQRIGRVGDPFDPERMTAVDVRSDPRVQPGTVLVVNRSGYAIHGSTKSTAQVTVSKP